MLKVLIVSVGKLSGGVEKYTLILGKMLKKKGVEVHYAIRRNAWLDSQLINERKVTIEMGKNSFSDMLKLKKYVKENGINIIHCNSNNGLFVCQLIRENCYCKKIGVIHGDVLIDQNHKGCFISKLYERMETWLIKRRCSKCIAVSNSIRNILVERGIPREKIDVVYTGIESIEYKTTPDYNAEVLNICTVGNLLPVKNQILLLSSLSLLNKKYPQVNYSCDVYGEGPERENLERCIETNNLNKVSLKGFDKNVRAKLNNYQIYIHTSKYESFGISIVEAMNAGCCVLANAVGGVNEIINNECGYILENETPDEIVDVLFYCYKNREELKRVAVNGKRRSQNMFSSLSMVNSILDVYNDMVCL